MDGTITSPVAVPEQSLGTSVDCQSSKPPLNPFNEVCPQGLQHSLLEGAPTWRGTRKDKPIGDGITEAVITTGVCPELHICQKPVSLVYP